MKILSLKVPLIRSAPTPSLVTTKAGHRVAVSGKRSEIVVKNAAARMNEPSQSSHADAVVVTLQPPMPPLHDRRKCSLPSSGHYVTSQDHLPTPSCGYAAAAATTTTTSHLMPSFRTRKPAPIDTDPQLLFSSCVELELVRVPPAPRHAATHQQRFFPSPRSVMEQEDSSSVFF